MALPGAALRWWPDFLREDAAACLFEALRADLPWRQQSIRMFGRWIAEPRLTSWHGDAGAAYRYSGRDNPPQPWTPPLVDLRERVGRMTGERFNSVLANLYRDGADHMGWHADDEASLGPAPVIASVSLGAERRLQFRPRPRGPIALQVDLPAGSLLVMAGGTQQHYHHRIPRTARPVGPRINLTFRLVGAAEDTLAP